MLNSTCKYSTWLDALYRFSRTLCAPISSCWWWHAEESFHCNISTSLLLSKASINCLGHWNCLGWAGPSHCLSLNLLGLGQQINDTSCISGLAAGGAGTNGRKVEDSFRNPLRGQEFVTGDNANITGTCGPMMWVQEFKLPRNFPGIYHFF